MRGWRSRIPSGSGEGNQSPSMNGLVTAANYTILLGPRCFSARYPASRFASFAPMHMYALISPAIARFIGVYQPYGVWASFSSSFATSFPGLKFIRALW